MNNSPNMMIPAVSAQYIATCQALKNHASEAYGMLKMRFVVYAFLIVENFVGQFNYSILAKSITTVTKICQLKEALSCSEKLLKKQKKEKRSKSRRSVVLI